jgi:hypothetical protein
MMTKSKIIRTPKSAKGGVTPEELAAMAEHTKMWIARAFRTTPIEPGQIIPAIKRLYAVSNLSEPRVVIVPSPLVMAFAYGASAAIWHGLTPKDKRRATSSATDDATDGATNDATSRATTNATSRATDIATHSATDDATRSATDDATFSATINATYSATASAEQGAAQACYELAGALGIACAQQWSNAYQGGNMWAPWDCYLTAYRDILGLCLPEHVAYDAWEQCAIHGGFRVMHPEFCIVSDFPEIIKIDAQNRPHCETGPSHRWRDGWSLYHWHGTRIPGEWIEDRASLTPQMALTWTNIEQRRAACEILGWERILSALNARTIDKDGDPEIGELVEVEIPEIGRERFLRVRCGTGRQFALPVPPHVKTALEANSWTFGFDDVRAFLKPEIRT